MAAKRKNKSKGKVVVLHPYKTKAAATRTLKKLKATKTHKVVKTPKGLFTLRKIAKKTKRR